MSAQTTEKHCYVVMGFGSKTDYQTGRVLDLDKSYRNIIKPAVEAAGLKCIRADEIVHFGMLDVPIYEQLLKADVVIADLSTSNANALYELGIRHALRPATTIVIAEKKMIIPFNINHTIVRTYEHLGPDISYEEVLRFRKELTNAIKEIIAIEPAPPDSPVYSALKGLQPPQLEDSLISGELVRESAALVSRPARGGKTLATLVEQGKQALMENRFPQAKELFERALQLDQNDPYLIRQRVLATYKTQKPDPVAALSNARKLLESLKPEASTDTETLELLGDIELALYEAKQGKNHLVRARLAYEKLYSIKGDWRSASALAYLIAQHAMTRRDVEEKAIDIGLAKRILRGVVELGKERLAEINALRKVEEHLPEDMKTEDRRQEQLRVWCAIAEAYFALGDNDSYLEARSNIELSESGGELLEVLGKQIKRFPPLLKNQVELARGDSAAWESSLPRREQHPANVASVPLSVPSAELTSPDEVSKEVFISYAWKDESEEIANKLDQSFKSRGVTIVRDKHALGFKGRIKQFMERIGQGRCVILIISDKYLKSENCLFELLQVSKQGNFSERVFPVVLDDARIYKPLERIRYVKYWEDQLAELDAAMKTVSSMNLQGLREDIDLYAEIRTHLPGLADILRDMNALTTQTHSESDFAELFEAVMTKLEG